VSSTKSADTDEGDAVLEPPYTFKDSLSPVTTGWRGSEGFPPLLSLEVLAVYFNLQFGRSAIGPPKRSRTEWSPIVDCLAGLVEPVRTPLSVEVGQAWPKGLCSRELSTRVGRPPENGGQLL
jgi:hypothetical protein